MGELPMNEHVYIIPGKPIALKRPRFGAKRVYDPQKNQKIEDGWILKSQHKGEPFHGKLHLDVTFYFKIPKARTKKLQKQINDYCHFRPDIDNLQKYVLDAGNGIIWLDDALISSVYCRKLYGEEEKTVIKVKELL